MRGFLRLHLTRRLSGLILLVPWLASLATAETEPLFKAGYQGYYAGMTVSFTRSLVPLDQTRYQLISKASTLMAKIDERSEFNRQGAVWSPIRYDYNRSIFGTQKRESLQFDSANKTVTYQDKKQRHTQALPQGTLDPTLYPLVLQAKLAQLGKKAPLSYRFARRTQIKDYQFTWVGEAPFVLQGKQYQAWVLRRQEVGDKQTEFWLIPDLDFTLARLEHSEDGDTHRLDLVSYEASPTFARWLRNP